MTERSRYGIIYGHWDIAKLVKAQDFDSCIRWFESSYPSHKKATSYEVAFLNDVRPVGQMLSASPYDVCLWAHGGKRPIIANDIIGFFTLS